MTIKIFQSGKGDALLITGAKGNVLVDGGVSAAYTEHISKELNRLTKNKIPIDLACVSHIDDDHIGGFLKMIEDLVDWRVFDFHNNNGNGKVKPPKSFRPPEIREIWHNAFHDVVKENAGEIEDMLAAHANILSASTNPLLVEMGEIAQSKGQAIQLSRRLKPEQLNIPLNKRFDNRLAMYREGTKAMKVGSLSIRMLAPFEEDLNKLRSEWNKWLTANKDQVKKIREKVEKDKPFLEASTFPDIAFYASMAEQMAPVLLEAIKVDNSTKQLGVREKVTTPNLASIMFLITENKKQLLMTGDGHCADIIKGLRSVKADVEQKGMHLAALKVQHHGSEHNTDENFCKLITADHYIFCGNGEHENPDLDVVRVFLESRTTNPAVTPQAGDKCTFWFNSSAAVTEGKKAHMKKVETLVTKFAAQHKNIKFKFMKPGKSSMTLEL
jgi:beta-lactamase superfamily II metal-dependent hydrolase